MGISLAAAVKQAHKALETPGHNPYTALQNLLAAVEAIHPDGRPQGSVYVVITADVFDEDDIRSVAVYSIPPAQVDEGEYAYQATIGGDYATRIEGTKR
jgi:hypothetical protein